MSEIKEVKAPLFRDPIYDGAADPTLIWNREEKSWWIVYTNRRANMDCPGFSWVHGTDLGVASSKDGGKTWLYRGILEGLEFEKGRNTFWAPEIIWHDGVYHMYVSYVQGVPTNWVGDRKIIHYTSLNLWDWKFEAILELSSNRVIDACIYKLPNGIWRMWYKDEVNKSHTYAADSEDLYNWKVVGEIIGDCSHEGANVFQWKGSYWMVIDTWKGLGVYSSKDCEVWNKKGLILDSFGKRNDDGEYGCHADVVVQGDEAYIFYFTHPGRQKAIESTIFDVIPYEKRRTSIQVAKLEFLNDNIVCDRDMSFEINLREE